MAMKPLRPCLHPGCRALTKDGYCSLHRPVPGKDRRPSPRERGYDSRWRRASKAFLKDHPWCAECLRGGRLEAATQVDHIIPHKGDPVLFWDEKNWQGLCRRCHSRKTAREDGGFGNKQRKKG